MISVVSRPNALFTSASGAEELLPQPLVSRLANYIRENPRLRDVLGCEPSAHAIYRFQGKLDQRPELRSAIISAQTSAFRSLHPDFGTDVAMDKTSVDAYCNSQPREYKDGPSRTLSDPDASFGFRSATGTRKAGPFYGYGAHILVCAQQRVPIVHVTETGKEHESNFALTLLDAARERGFNPKTCAVDLGYWGEEIHHGFEERATHPVSLLKKKPRIDNDELGLAEVFNRDRPHCKHGEWKFAGTDYKRRRTKWRCPTAECSPRSKWLTASLQHPLIPRKTTRWRDLYRHGRMASEGVNSTLKGENALDDLRGRGMDRARCHVDLSIIALLAKRLALARDHSPGE